MRITALGSDRSEDFAFQLSQRRWETRFVGIEDEITERARAVALSDHDLDSILFLATESSPAPLVNDRRIGSPQAHKKRPYTCIAELPLKINPIDAAKWVGNDNSVTVFEYGHPHLNDGLACLQNRAIPWVTGIREIVTVDKLDREPLGEGSSQNSLTRSNRTAKEDCVLCHAAKLARRHDRMAVHRALKFKLKHYPVF